MEALSNPVVATILFLGILVFVHEAGHFLVGKWCGISVEVFSIGFGPTLISFQRKETSYRISAIPLGGYVKFFGSVRTEDVPEELKGTEFYRAPIWARLATVAAGPIANFLLAIVVFTIIGLHGVKLPPAVVGEIMKGSPADRAGLSFNDQIKEINGEDVKTWKDLQRIVADNPGEKLTFVIERDGAQQEISLVPEEIEDKELARSKGRIGISPTFVPSTLTVTDSNKPIAMAGVQTGFRVEKVRFDDGPEMDAKYWRQLKKLWFAADGAQTMTLMGFRAKQDPRERDDEERALQSIEIDVSQVESLTPENLGVRDSQLTIGVLLEEVESLQPGDAILAWNDQSVDNAFALSEIISENTTPKVALTVLRNGESLVQEVALKPVDVQRAAGKLTLYTLPVMFWGSMEQAEFVEEVYSNPIEALGYGFQETYTLTKTIAGAVVGLFTGDMPLQALGGPIAIAKVASDSVKMGLIAFLHLLAMISINLGLLNLIPIPVLDGGQLLLIGAEGVARKPLPDAAIEGYQKIGFVMVLALIAMATYNDLGRFWASMMKGASSLF
ncbi:site-2 protease family protein [Pseudobacteriovorax antillogorgiicola]|uniref:Regulator of sigma E protease n=1 Tax=Pseudobacteriovorax antillogorgiicola TaxID=1513793 RepID=A0A1Y6B6W6_9BACT|nr:site-2 protease family protein [Pseudobacteriovorax antillogorgiicola]TCS59547.1 regulator of sigma E protease [Pseudobacteriovorax antillogorgiicola]SME87756.1 regulator of sigma E protease [Pseudobacteriovorax antillogorgiicola]